MTYKARRPFFPTPSNAVIGHLGPSWVDAAIAARDVGPAAASALDCFVQDHIRFMPEVNTIKLVSIYDEVHIVVL